MQAHSFQEIQNAVGRKDATQYGPGPAYLASDLGSSNPPAIMLQLRLNKDLLNQGRTLG